MSQSISQALDFNLGEFYFYRKSEKVWRNYFKMFPAFFKTSVKESWTASTFWIQKPKIWIFDPSIVLNSKRWITIQYRMKALFFYYFLLFLYNFRQSCSMLPTQQLLRLDLRHVGLMRRKKITISFLHSRDI